MRGTPFRKERERALQVPNCGVVPAFCSREPSETEFGSRFGQRIGAQRVEQQPAAIAVSRLEQRLGKLHACRDVIG